MPDVFISYARKDAAFVHRFHDALIAHQRETWVDWEDIPPSASWYTEIKAAIEAADTFIFVLSPDSVASQVCGEEVAHAAKNNKRLVPIVRRNVNPQQVHPALAQLNWIFFRRSDDFDSAFELLLKALDTDLEWVHTHTRLLMRAVEWDGKTRNNAFVLRGADLRTAEEWLTQAAIGKEPRPTPLQSDYIRASRKAATRQQRTVLAGVTIALVVAIVLALVATYQSYVANDAKSTAVAETNVRATAEAQAITERTMAQSRELAASAIAQLQVDPELGILLAIESADIQHTDQAEEALRQSLLASPVRLVLHGHTDVARATFSPDGKFVLSASQDGTARVWDAATGKMIAKLSGIVAAFSPDGRLVSSGDNEGIVTVSETSSGSLVTELRGHSGAITSAAFSPDGKWLVTASKDNTVQVWEVVSGKSVGVLVHAAKVNTASFGPDSTFVVTASEDKTARVWEWSSGRSIELAGNKAAVKRAMFSPDGQKVVTVASQQIRMWDAGTGKTVFELGEGQDEDTFYATTGAALSFDGRRMVTWEGDVFNLDRTARVWDVNTGKEVAVLRGHTGNVLEAAFSEDSRFIVTTSWDDTARVWKTETGEAIAVLRGQSGLMRNVAFSSDGRHVVTSSTDGTIRIWESGTGEGESVIGPTNSPNTESFAAEFSENGKLIVTSDKESVRVWKAEADGNVTEIRQYKKPFAYRGRWIVVPNGNRSLRILETSTGLAIGEMRDFTGIVTSTQVSPDGSFLVATTEENTGYVWDVATGRSVAELQGYSGKASFSPDSKFIVTPDSENIATVWELATGKRIAESPKSASEMTDCEFSPDGKMILAANYGGDPTAMVWEANTGRLIAGLKGSDNWLFAEAFSPDSKFIVTAGYDGTPWIWDAATGQLVTELHGLTGPAIAVSYSPLGRFISAASGGIGLADNTARVWDTKTGRILYVLRGHSGYVWSARFSPDGKWVVTAGDDGTARIYACEVCVPIEDLLALARQRVTRELTCQERQQYLHENAVCPTPASATTPNP